eukprot:TRINITY_DN62513_c0_g1_i1.p1 TRINITY_DN62513_c0_g1~~TRINITY_DN62513_c0_g1_i1.p1  ORF type:complete len:372 (+),score=52.47 TRINITY_DN62513_c0_g1_i1:94-1209(+)
MKETVAETADDQSLCDWGGVVAKKVVGQPLTGRTCYFPHFEAAEDGWLMLGHGVEQKMAIVKEGPLVKRNTGWKRIWTNMFSRENDDCQIYIPVHDDPNFVACGVVFYFSKGLWDWPELPSQFNVAMLHKSVVRPDPLAAHCWATAKNQSHHDVELKMVNSLGTAWPTSASMWRGDLMPPHEINPRGTCYHSRLSLLSLRINNTFFDEEPDELDLEFFNTSPSRQRSFSWPNTPARSPREVYVAPRMEDLDFDSIEAAVMNSESVDVSASDSKEMVVLGTPEAPTLGSVSHAIGSKNGVGCKPCAFFTKKNVTDYPCRNGALCAFCHLCEPKLKKRGGLILKRTKRYDEIKAELGRGRFQSEVAKADRLDA